jgi:NCAIR mutase (PurE)-related protein
LRLSAGRKIEDEREAVRFLRAAERGGLSAGEWARAHGVDGRSLRAWRMNIDRRGAPAPVRRRKPKPKPAARALVELVSTAASAAPRASAGRYVLEVGGARLEFGDDVSTATLRRVLEALRSC